MLSDGQHDLIPKLHAAQKVQSAKLIVAELESVYNTH
jgi:hypothetical protein